MRKISRIHAARNLIRQAAAFATTSSFHGWIDAAEGGLVLPTVLPRVRDNLVLRLVAGRKSRPRGLIPSMRLELSEPPVMPLGHQPVLLKEVLGFLAPVPAGRYLDCTFGGGGHSKALLGACGFGHPGCCVGPGSGVAKDRAAGLLSEYAGRFQLLDMDFGRLQSLENSDFDGILFDLGVSSFQLDDPERGFSFRSDAPADMRMDPRTGASAHRWLETATEEMIVRAVRDHGEEPHWKRVVRAIMAARGTGSLARTASLAKVIEGAIPERDRRTSRIHPATRAFQGIRIAVNDELGAP